MNDHFTGGFFDYGDKEYSVASTTRAVQHKKPVWVNVSSLINELLDGSAHGDEPLGSPAWEARSEEADLRYPILVVRGPDGPFVADGLHRLWKAWQHQQPRILARIISPKELVA